MVQQGFSPYVQTRSTSTGGPGLSSDRQRSFAQRVVGTGLIVGFSVVILGFFIWIDRFKKRSSSVLAVSEDARPNRQPPAAQQQNVPGVVPAPPTPSDVPVPGADQSQSDQRQQPPHGGRQDITSPMIDAIPRRVSDINRYLILHMTIPGGLRLPSSVIDIRQSVNNKVRATGVRVTSEVIHPGIERRRGTYHESDAFTTEQLMAITNVLAPRNRPPGTQIILSFTVVVDALYIPMPDVNVAIQRSAEDICVDGIRLLERHIGQMRTYCIYGAIDQRRNPVAVPVFYYLPHAVVDEGNHQIRTNTAVLTTISLETVAIQAIFLPRWGNQRQVNDRLKTEIKEAANLLLEKRQCVGCRDWLPYTPLMNTLLTEQCVVLDVF